MRVKYTFLRWLIPGLLVRLRRSVATVVTRIG